MIEKTAKDTLDWIIEEAAKGNLGLIQTKHKKTGKVTDIICIKVETDDGMVSIYPIAPLLPDIIDEYELPEGAEEVE